MKAFVEVATAGGFSNAARKTNQSKALLSKHVAQLESSLKVRLLQRTTRHVSLTEMGKLYLDKCMPILEELDELESRVQNIHTEPSGELTISAPTSFSELHLMNVISLFGSRYPDVKINMALSDRLVDIVEEGFDLALRIGKLADSSLVARRITTINTVICASPDYLEQYGEPLTPKELTEHSCIIDTNHHKPHSWTFQFNGKMQSINIKGQFQVNNAVAVKELALAGHGIALCPQFVMGDSVKQGKLKLIFADNKFEHAALYAVYSHRRHLSKKLLLFIELLQDYFTDHTM